MTTNLWKKEVIGDRLLYVDLLKSVDTSHFGKLDNSLKALEEIHSQKLAKCHGKSAMYTYEGIKLYKEMSFESAMESFNQALRFAEDDDGMAIIFRNRADCFAELELYDQGLADIDLAVRSDCSEETLANVEKQRTKLQTMKDSDNGAQSTEKDRTLDFEANEKIPCLANVLTIENNEQFGRHIVAKCDIDVGQCVLMEESFANVSRGTYHTCYTCTAEKRNFIPCPNCTDVVFCSTECMQSNEVHQIDCQTFYHRMPHKVQFIIRTILVAVTTFSDIDSLMKFVEDSVASDELPDSMNDSRSKYQMYLKLKKSSFSEKVLFDLYDLFTLAMSVSTIKEIFDTEPKKRFLMHLLLHHLAVNVNNGYDSDTTTSIGAILCLFNHSCAPNLYNYAIDNQKYCVTIRPVKKGEQLFISYLGKCFDIPCQERQRELKSKWNFECKCNRCKLAGRSVDNIGMRQDSSFKFVQRYVKNSNGVSDFMNTAVIKKKCIKFLQKYGHLPFSTELQFISDVYTALI